MIGTGRWSWGEPVEPVRRHLLGGGVVAIPSESSYGLAVDPRSADGVEAIYRIKRRERGKPLLVVAAEVGQLAPLGADPESSALRALGTIWPAPLTAIVPIEKALPATAGVATLAVRIPAHERLRKLLSDIGFAVTATSANRAGESPILDPDVLEDWLGGHGVLICDDGLLPGGPASTLVAPSESGWAVLRQGAFPAEALPDPTSPT